MFLDKTSFSPDAIRYLLCSIVSENHVLSLFPPPCSLLSPKNLPVKAPCGCPPCLICAPACRPPPRAATRAPTLLHTIPAPTRPFSPLKSPHKKPDLMLRSLKPKRLSIRINEGGELDDGYSHQFCRRAVYPVSQRYRAFLCAASCRSRSVLGSLP